MKLYAVHDKKAKSLSAFHVLKSDAVASRSFSEAVLDGQSPYGKYPDDFELVALCDVSQDYDMSLVDMIEVVSQPVVVITAAQVLAAQPKPDKQLPLQLEA